MKTLHLLIVGRQTSTALLGMEKKYIRDLSQFKVIIHEIKARDEDTLKESELIHKKISLLKKESTIGNIILLSERGKQYTSEAFAHWLNKLFEGPSPVFIIGGASGHHPSLYQRYPQTLSLGKLTLPHRLARLLLVEQFYRAQSIWINHPYHK